MVPTTAVQRLLGHGGWQSMPTRRKCRCARPAAMRHQGAGAGWVGQRTTIGASERSLRTPHDLTTSVIVLLDPARGTSLSEPATRGRTPTLLATTTLGGARRRSGTSFFLWASLCSEPMSACSAALALGGGGTVRRIASSQDPALSSALGGSLVGWSL